MNKEKDDFFLHSNEVNHINREDYVTIALSSPLSQDNHKTLVLM